MSGFLAGLLLFAAVGGGLGPTAAAHDPRDGFVDVTEALGLDYRVTVRPDDQGSDADHGSREDGGLALLDIDDDGRPELYVAHGNHETGRLFTYDGNRFVGVHRNRGIEPAGMDRAGYFIDLDGDGRTDFISIQSQGVEIFRSDAAGYFKKAADPFGIPPNRATHSMAAADYDGDGDVDLFFAHWNNPWDRFGPPPPHYLWRNDGGGRYEDVSRTMPLRPARIPESKVVREMSFTPTFADIDADGDPDLLLAADFGTSQILRNDGGGVFTDTGGAVLTDENGMGAAVGDYDRDGDPDWFVTSIHDPDKSSGFGPTGNRLYRNIAGTGRFEDATEQAGVREGGWGWGTCFADFDNDGHPDLFQTNGWFDEYREGPDGKDVEVTAFLEDPSRLFMSNGDGTFTERAAELGIDHRGQGRGVVCADYDGDGRVDVFIANHGAAPSVYANVFENGNHWLAVDLAGRHGNPLGIGARVTVRTPSGSQVQEVRFGGAYLSQPPPTLTSGWAATARPRPSRSGGPGRGARSAVCGTYPPTSVSRSGNPPPWVICSRLRAAPEEASVRKATRSPSRRPRPPGTTASATGPAKAAGRSRTRGRPERPS